MRTRYTRIIQENDDGRVKNTFFGGAGCCASNIVYTADQGHFDLCRASPRFVSTWPRALV